MIKRNRGLDALTLRRGTMNPNKSVKGVNTKIVKRIKSPVTIPKTMKRILKEGTQS